MRMNFFIIIIISSLSLIFPKSVHASYPQHIKLFPVSGSECIVIWLDSNHANERYKAQFILKNRELNGEPFQILSYENIAFNSADFFMVTKRIDSHGFYPYSNYDINGIVYDRDLFSSDTMRLASGSWPECGFGFLGFQEQILGLTNDFLYFSQFDGAVTVQRYNQWGELLNGFHHGGGKINLTADKLSNDSYLYVWFTARPYDLFFSYGIYAASFQSNDTAIADSIKIKSFPRFKNLDYFDLYLAPRLQLVSISDTTYQLFSVEPDSLVLYSYILNQNGSILNTERIVLEQLAEEYNYLSVPSFSVSNLSSGTRAVFITTKKVTNNETKTTNYLYYFDNHGLHTGFFTTASTSYFPSSSFKFKTGNDLFFNPFLRPQGTFIKVYQNFTLVDSFKVGTITSVQEENIVFPSDINLSQNYPNPFNSDTKIQYTLIDAGEFELSVFNAIGQKIKVLDKGYKSPGFYKTIFSAEGLSSGIYFYVLRSQNTELVGKMLYLE